MLDSKKIFKSVAVVTVYSVFTRLISFIFKIYLSRYLGPEVIGLYQICLSMFYLFASISASGIPTVLSRRTAEANALGEKKGGSLVTSALLLGIVLSSVTVGLLALLSPHLGFLFSDERCLPLFLIMLPALLSTTIYSIIRSWFWGRKQFKYFSVTEMVEELLRILFTAFLISGVIGGVSGSYGIALAFLLSDVTVAVILVILFFVKGGRLSKPKDVKNILAPAIPVSAMRIFSSLVATFLAIVLPLRLMSAGMNATEATAAFGRIAGMANPLIFAPNALISSLAIVLIPEMSENGAKKDMSALNTHINTGVNFALLISGLFMCVFISLGEAITTLLYDDAVSGQYLEIAAFTMLPMAVSQITQSSLNSIGLEKQCFLAYLAGTVFMVAAILILPAYIGIYSVAVATFLDLVISAGFNILSLKKHAGLKPKFLKTAILVLLFTFPCAFFARELNEILARYLSLWSVLISAPLAVVMYVVFAAVADLVDFRGFIARKKKKKKNPLKQLRIRKKA